MWIMPCHSEIKIKLTGDIDKLHAILQSLELSPFVKLSCQKNYETYYYDTKDYRLIKNNIVLRRRKLEENKNILGLKWRNPRSSLFERGEFEVGIQDERIDLKAFGETWNQKITQVISNSEIELKFSVIVQREIYRLCSGDTLIEISLDRGKIISTNKTCEIKEIELELKSGQVSILYNLAINFVEKLHLSVELESKAERGFLLEGGRLRKYIYKFAGGFDLVADPEAFITYSINTLIKKFSEQIRILSDGFHPHHIHQTRVILRRLRVIFSALKRISSNNDFDELNGEARRMASLLGKVREYDVLEDLINSFLKYQNNNDYSIDELISQIRIKKEISLENSKIIISQGMAAIFIIKVERLINKAGYLKPVNESDHNNVPFKTDKISSLILTKIEKRVKKHGVKIKDLHDIGLHQLRIDLKKLRYLADFLSPIYEKKAVKEYIKHVSQLQEYLGEHNDIINAEKLLQQISKNLSESAQFSAGKIIGWYACADLRSTKKLNKKWKKFSLVPHFW
jgi:inorganic triphosphatase YgiF